MQLLISCICPKCHTGFTTYFEDEDFEDGCTSRSVLCPTCLDKLAEGLTHEDVETQMRGVVPRWRKS